jgi:hypothetical protein
MIFLHINETIAMGADSISTSESIKQVVDLLESMHNSINSTIPHIMETAENTKPEPYTVESLNLSWWNLIIATTAAIFGFIGAVFGFYGYKYSRLTAENVSRISSKTQFAIFEEFAKDLYMKFIYLLICDIEMRESNYRRYPPERLIEKMKLPNSKDIFKIDKYSNNEKVYMLMRSMGARMNNYNIELDILKELVGDGEKDKLIDYTLTSILYKPLNIINHLRYLYFSISKDENSYNNILTTLLSFHFNHLYDNIGLIDEWKNDYRYIDFISYEQDNSYAYYPLVKSVLSFSKKTGRVLSDKILSVENNKLNEGVKALLIDKESLSEWLTPIFELEGCDLYREILFEESLDSTMVFNVRQEWDITKLLPIVFCLDVAMEIKNVTMFEY